MKQVKKRFAVSLMAIVIVLGIAALMVSSGAVKVVTVEESMKPYIKTGITVECAAGILVYVLWFAGYFKRLQRAINPGTEPSGKVIWGAAAFAAALVLCVFFMVLKGVSIGAVWYGVGYALFVGISTAAAAAYTEF